MASARPRIVRLPAIPFFVTLALAIASFSAPHASPLSAQAPEGTGSGDAATTEEGTGAATDSVGRITEGKIRVLDLLRYMQDITDKLLAWQATVGKPLIFTEVGYPSQKGAAGQPSNYYGSKTVDLDVQRMCLEAFLDAWDGVDQVSRIFIFEWWGHGGPDDIGYTPLGKPAEALLRKWFLDSHASDRD